ncbi:MAG TPA: PmoA family protein, partial [Candidatus Hydrogenedentes bacterium]|nr:PmoA family protein [Candidatus Hydrogenedentota bacterium]
MTAERFILFIVAPVLLCAGTAPAGDGTAATGADSPRTLSIGGKVLAEYRYTGVPYKPYISVFRTPAGINVLRDAPADHLHHHALMFAIAVDGIDFWQEGNAPGRQVHREFLKSGDASSRQETAQFVERLDWLAPETETPLLHEKRSVRIFDPLHFGASLMTWETELSVPEG